MLIYSYDIHYNALVPTGCRISRQRMSSMLELWQPPVMTTTWCHRHVNHKRSRNQNHLFPNKPGFSSSARSVSLHERRSNAMSGTVTNNVKMHESYASLPKVIISIA